MSRRLSTLLFFLASLHLPFAAPAAIEVVPERIVIVTPDNPIESVRYAAQELAWHLEKATGEKFQIVSESSHDPLAVCIYLGDTQVARGRGIDTSKLSPESFVICTTGVSLIIAGRDAPGDPLHPNTTAGTLFGVYEYLQTHLGVVWAWPGELGTFVPKHRTRTILQSAIRNPKSEIHTPHFLQRQVRGGLTFTSDHPGLGFSPDASADYARAQTIYLRRHRMGRAQPMAYGHAFTDWWKKYGAEHPEWFQLVAGKRGPVGASRSYSMCVSNPEFQQKLVTLWREKRQQQITPAAPLRSTSPRCPVDYLNACENGINGLCECDACRALDGPRPADFDTYYPKNSKVTGQRFVTDRYAKYWLAVQREAAKTNPDVTLIVYNYFNYFHAPSPEIKLNPRILVGSYPSGGWFPRPPAENQWYYDQWLGWEKTGARLFSRGNYCLDGYNMPHIFAHAFADEFRHQYRHGMVATDYDALTGHWATQGPNIYVLMRLHNAPDATADTLLAEYYAAFGPASAHIKTYFDYWENFATATRDTTRKTFDDANASRWRTYAAVAHHIYTEETFAAAAAILTRAAATAARDPESLARVRFLQTGLEHARLCARAASLLSTAAPQTTPEHARAALADLIAYRRAHEREWISNLNHAAWMESASWTLPQPPPSL